jgi:hypothetical protein
VEERRGDGAGRIEDGVDKGWKREWREGWRMQRRKGWRIGVGRRGRRE